MNNIKQLRKEQGISSTELAQKLNMSQGNLSKIENGLLELKDDMIQKIATILNVSPSALKKAPIAEGTLWIKVINPEIISLPPMSSLPIPAHMLPQTTQNLALFVLPDDTMSPRFPTGSLMVIDKNEKNTNQNGIYLLQINQTTVLRRLQNTYSQQINLLCDNPCYPVQPIATSSINIIGKAISAISSISF